MFAIAGRLALFVIRAISHCFRPPFYFRNMVQQFWTIGYNSLPVVGLTAVFTGAVLALQASVGFSKLLLEKAKDTPNATMVHELVLRSQSQAVYSPVNIGHFGLALPRYAHFTSPIRRYADLLVHRALIAGCKLGDGSLPPGEGARFTAIGEHISQTERRAAAAERDAIDRFVAAFLADRVGEIVPGRVTGVTRFGLFVWLDETGADGLVPIASLPNDFYDHDEANHALVGRRWVGSTGLANESWCDWSRQSR